MPASPTSNISMLNTTASPGKNPNQHVLSFKPGLVASCSVPLAAVIIFGNTLVIVSYKRNMRLRTRTNAFLVSLAISDLLVGSISLPMWIFYILMKWQVTRSFNAVFKSLDVFGALASIFHLTAISIERYISVSRPFYYKRLEPSFHRALILTAWSAAGFLASLSLLTIPFFLEPSWIKLYSMFIFACGFVVPTSIIACMYAGIFTAARSLLQRNPYPSTSQPTKNLARYYQGERKVAITVALVTCLFVTAWVPFFVVSIMAAYCTRCLPSSPDSLLNLIVAVKWVHYANSAINPLVYACRDAEMRKTFFRLLGIPRGVCCCRSEDVTPWGFPLRVRVNQVSGNQEEG